MQTPGVAAVAAWFDVLEAAQDTLHNVQYPLRAMELPPYPAGGVCGIANLGIALDHIIEAQKALDLVTEQLRHWRAMNEAYGPSSNAQGVPDGCLARSMRSMIRDKQPSWHHRFVRLIFFFRESMRHL